MAQSEYSDKQLKDEARSMVKGLGKLTGWSVVVSNDGASLHAHFTRRYNPSRPLASQASEYVSMKL